MGNLAPNGKKSNLTPEQYKLVRTAAFKKWFGDWERLALLKIKDSGIDDVTLNNISKDISKVVDENGEPLVVYHGTNVKEQFNIFDFDKADLGFHFGTYQQANDRSETKIGIKGYKKIITSYFLNIRKLFSITDIGEFEYPQRYLNELLSDNLITEKEAKENGFFNAYYKEDNKIIRDFLVKKYKNIGFEYNNQYEGKGKSFIALNNNQMKLADGSNTTFDAENPDIRYEEGGLLAPNLKPSNLTIEQWHLVRTPEFKAWFGDWENDPENSSKVVDTNGEPLVVYHGTNIDFTKFDIKQIGKSTNNLGHYGYGFYFSDDIRESKNYGNKILNCYLNIRKPFLATDKEFDLLKENGFYGIDDKVNLSIDFKDLHKKIKQIDKNAYYFMSIAEQNGLENVWDIYLDSKKNANLEKINLNDLYDILLYTNLTETNDEVPQHIIDDIEQIGIIPKLNVGYKYIQSLHWVTDLGNNSKIFTDFVKELNYDGVIIGSEYVAFYPNQIKLADGSNITFDANNPDIRYEQGGNIGQEITCVNCGWHWNTNQSDEFDKYICHKCGFDNRTFYDSEPIGYNDGGKLKTPHTIYEIAKKHNVSESVIENALTEGIKTEKEHTTDKNIAETIALQHLWESPKYYEKLKIMEKELNLDEHYEDIRKIYAIGGVVDPIMSFSTPSGEPTKLTYLQQVLVRTAAFKNWFGDWESAAKQFILNGRQDYVKVFKNVSKVVDKITFEPKVVYHGTRTDAEFFIFDVSKKDGVGRPYGYFAHNEEYSRNFTTSSQRSVPNSQPFMYKCFASVKNPFYAIGHEYYNIQQDAEYWTNEISISIARDKYGTNADENKINQIKKVVDSQIGGYVEQTFAVGNMSFWLLMAKDVNKNFKFFLNNYGYDGVFYAEEFGMPYDVDNPAEFTEAVTVFEPKQVKLADGRNINFDPMNEDIRFKNGGKVPNSDEIIINKDYFMGKRENLRNLLTNNKYAEGGEVVANKLDNGNNGKKGGYFEGRSHADGGIKAYNKDTGQMIEVEGQEVIITKGAVNDTSKREFEGEMLTNREILSRINQSGGGVSFEKGGQMSGSPCGCSGKKYKYGGEMIDDYSIVKMMNEPFKIINDNFADARAFADMLVQKLK